MKNICLQRARPGRGGNGHRRFVLLPTLPTVSVTTEEMRSEDGVQRRASPEHTPSEPQSRRHPSLRPRSQTACLVGVSVSGFLETASGWGSWRSEPLSFGSSRVPPTHGAGAMGGHLIH